MKPGSMPGGTCFGLVASLATSLMVSERLDLGDENTPSAKSTSPTSTSNWCAAMRLPFSITLSDAISSAEPPMVAEREPPVPSPSATASVSPEM